MPVKVLFLIVALILVVQAILWLEKPSTHHSIQSSFMSTPRKLGPPSSNPLKDVIDNTNESQ